MNTTILQKRIFILDCEYFILLLTRYATISSHYGFIASYHILNYYTSLLFLIQ